LVKPTIFYGNHKNALFILTNFLQIFGHFLAFFLNLVFLEQLMAKICSFNFFWTWQPLNKMCLEGEGGGRRERRGNLNWSKNSHDIHLVIAVAAVHHYHHPHHRLETYTIRKMQFFQNFFNRGELKWIGSSTKRPFRTFYNTFLELML